MGRVWNLKFQWALAFAVVLSACSRPVEERGANLVITMPKSLGKVGSLALPANRKACFGVSVTGPGIEVPPADACSPQMGRIGGFKALGESIELAVPKGLNRKIDLYVFLQAEGVNQECPQIGARLSASQLLNTYLVASKSNVEILANDVSVSINYSFPGVDNHLAAQMSLPSTCTDTTTTPTSNANRFEVSVSTGKSANTGNSIVLKGRVGAFAPDKVLTGSNIKLYVRE
ncbi:MAG TPA: hypothetical protein DCL41_02410 [Bdellovibrionales bacterium]|nr:hypothetical protein [Pseudobdellovibrionaceae bacterium]HAG90693.1 hypothetical protein [Bdellovibrionales bacterium]|tara:strand:- start:661 stop:1353 length:693 start_codon:yes stop_codon:yes gene_type:complete